MCGEGEADPSSSPQMLPPGAVPILPPLILNQREEKYQVAHSSHLFLFQDF